MALHTDRGNKAETRARQYLEQQGLRLREANWRCRLGELDLVMTSGDTLVFVEVRYRSGDSHGGGIDSIDRKKRRRLIRAAARYLQQYRLHDHPARFDVVGVGPGHELQWIAGAFTTDDG